MTAEERRKRPEHHVVHDYANLVSSGLLITKPQSNDALLKIAPVNSHVWHAFYMNCRKMYEFFHHQKSKTYLRAQQFVNPGVTFTFKHWTGDVQDFMNTHMLHVGGARVTNEKVSTGADDTLYLAEFQGCGQGCWRTCRIGTRRSSVKKSSTDWIRSSGTAGR
jgi:hypothetical protein